MKTQVVIIGGGPAGMLLSEILFQNGIESIVLEKCNRDYVLSRIRAGILEQSTVDILKRYGLGCRITQDGISHSGIKIVWGEKNNVDIDIKKHVGKELISYGQTQIQRDLYNAADHRNATLFTEVTNIRLMDIDTMRPYVTFTHCGDEVTIQCDFIAGCDGFHGVSRKSIPRHVLREFETVYPFAWLGVLSSTPPLPAITYVKHYRGFALASMRSLSLSRYYIQVPINTNIHEWHDDRFWVELKARFPFQLADQIVTGPSIEKSITPLRSCVVEPMRYGRLFLAGDAAHIAPPTGAKGLNLAVSDVFYLSQALRHFYKQRSMELLNAYSQNALKRVWQSIRFSWYLTDLLHRYPSASKADQRAQDHAMHYLKSSLHAQARLAAQYAGIPYLS